MPKPTEPRPGDAPTLLVSDAAFLAHDAGPSHPESPRRLQAILDDLRGSPVAGTAWASPRPATDEELLAVHPSEHVSGLAALAGRHAQLDPDTAMSPGSWQAARLAAGAAAMAMEETWTGRARNAFALVRPPGHHAESTRAMGFCLINNAAVAAERARALGARRVAVLDWDVHHGNGTQELFEHRDDVLYLSSHQYPFYPGTGAPDEIGLGAGRGFTVNCALPGGQSDADYGAVFDDLFLPALDRFAPDAVIVSAGFDAHKFDPLAEMRVSEAGFAAMCRAVLDLGKPTVLLLEGGYVIPALVASVRACVEMMAGGHAPPFPTGVGPATARAIAETRTALARAGHPTAR